VGECFFWYRPTRVVPDQRPLNGCCCCCYVTCQLITSHMMTIGLVLEQFWASKLHISFCALTVLVAKGRALFCHLPQEVLFQNKRGKKHTHTHSFNGPFSRTTRVSRYQKSKTNLDFTEARDSKWQCHQLGRIQVCTSLQTDNHASTPTLSFLQA